MSIKAKDFDTVINKFEFQTRQAGDLLAWLEYDGKVVVRTKRSRTQGKDLPFQHQIRQQLKLNADQLRRAIRCKLTKEDYIQILEDKGII